MIAHMSNHSHIIRLVFKKPSDSPPLMSVYLVHIEVCGAGARGEFVTLCCFWLYRYRSFISIHFSILSASLTNVTNTSNIDCWKHLQYATILDTTLCTNRVISCIFCVFLLTLMISSHSQSDWSIKLQDITGAMTSLWKKVYLRQKLSGSA